MNMEYFSISLCSLLFLFIVENQTLVSCEQILVFLCYISLSPKVDNFPHKFLKAKFAFSDNFMHTYDILLHLLKYITTASCN